MNPEIESDINRIKQVVINLLSNACKFTFEGSIIVTISDKRDIPLRVGEEELEE
jgi:signal transduction histidine kinase